MEPACGAALAAVYDSATWAAVSRDIGAGPVVVVVCGGSGVSAPLVAEWAKQ